MVEDLGIAKDHRQVGYYSGLVESAFSFAQFATVLMYGRLSDRIGRKPVLLFGLLGVTISVTSFGFSRSLPAMIIARCLAGILNGNVGVIKASLAESTNEQNEGFAFAALPLFWALGAAAGNLLGGTLSNPAKHFPHLFGNSQLFLTYPYLLPCIVAAFFPLSAFLLGLIFFKESLQQPLVKVAENEEDGARQDVEPTPTIWQVLSYQHVGKVLLNYGSLALMTQAIGSIIPLYCFTRREHGGLGLSERQIGAALSIQALMVTTSQVLIFAPVHNKLGSILFYRTFILFYPFALLALNAASITPDEPTRTRMAFLYTGLLLLAIGNCCFSANMIIINSSAPSQKALGSINGLAQTMAALVRGIGPASANSIWAFSVSRGFRENVIWIVFFGLSIVCSTAPWTLPKTLKSWRDR